jgi:hypothetical protein
MGIKITQNLMLISNSLMPLTKVKSKKHEKMHKTKILKIRIVFWL